MFTFSILFSLNFKNIASNMRSPEIETPLKENVFLFQKYAGKNDFYKSFFMKIKEKEEIILEAEYLKNEIIEEPPLLILFPIYRSFDGSRILGDFFLFLFNTDILILSQKRFFFWHEPDAIKSIETLIEKIRRMKEISLKRLNALHLLINYLKENGRAKKIGILGISYGGIEGIDFLLKYKEVNCAVIINAGAHISKLITSTEEPDIKEKLNKIKKNLNISDSKLEKIIQENLFELDPLSFKPPSDSKKILMVNSEKDRIVPLSFARALWFHLGKPELILTPYGHRGTLLYFFKVFPSLYAIFSKTFKK